MKSIEFGVKPESNYYMYSPSLQAKSSFFYPLFTGLFYYNKGYKLERNSYDSFLIMYIKKGKLSITINSNTIIASENQIVLINCFNPHSYSACENSEILWLHFDGPCSKNYFDLITNNSKYIFTLKDTYYLSKRLKQIYKLFNDGTPIKEPLTSRFITDILTELLLCQNNTSQYTSPPNVIEESIAFISEHLSDKISLDSLAANIHLSPYYFTRLFKKETGFTPHQYILSARINYAKFLLKNSNTPVKEICFITGFSNESSFCTCFKNWVNMTPNEYRNNTL
ncbi:MAG: AraC family transcriptional regulator [Clostridiaceae bacterium]